MPWDGSTFTPTGRIVRVVTAHRAATVDIDVVPGRAFAPARKVNAFSTGIAFDGMVVNAGIPFDGRRATTTLEPGDRLVVSIDDEYHDPLNATAALDLADRTGAAWEHHLDYVTYDGPYADAVRRSLLVLKGLTYHASGAVVAAATTSLPERIGGERNWDYRYAWVRDASLAIDAAYDSGLVDEGERFVLWLKRVLGDGQFPLRPLYDVEGEEVGDEEHILPLPGFRRSQPVRVGNAAAGHLQLDIYADLVGALHADQFRRHSGSGVDELWPALADMADWLTTAWQQPDRGIWEIRAEPRHLHASKVGCWYALARMVELALVRNPLDFATVPWKAAANEILRWLDDNPIPDEDIDASLLVIAWRGPWPVEHPIVEDTVDRILRRLSDGPFVYRYTAAFDDGLPAGEGAFLATSFWAVKALARLGRWEEAHERMESLVAVGGPLGLLPEEADPRTGEFLGNLPQAFSHLALIEAALALRSGPR
jgi:GH15 family glucan-1,4-alpha-glucosidase